MTNTVREKESREEEDQGLNGWRQWKKIKETDARNWKRLSKNKAM